MHMFFFADQNLRVPVFGFSGFMRCGCCDHNRHSHEQTSNPPHLRIPTRPKNLHLFPGQQQQQQQQQPGGWTRGRHLRRDGRLWGGSRGALLMSQGLIRGVRYRHLGVYFLSHVGLSIIESWEEKGILGPTRGQMSLFASSSSSSTTTSSSTSYGANVNISATLSLLLEWTPCW